MVLVTVFKSIKMIYQLAVYALTFTSFLINILWLCCNLASAGIPWFIFLLFIICIISKFIKLQSPDQKTVLSLLGHSSSSTGQTGDPEDDSCSELVWPICFRGGAFDAPENSVAGIKMCITRNCRSIMLDLDMTSCGELVILHKSTLEKANYPGGVQQTKFENLENFNISEYHPLSSQFQPEKVIRLANLLTLIENTNLTVFLLITNVNRKLVDTLAQTIDNNIDFTKHFIVCSRSPFAIYQLRKLFPTLVCGLWMEKLGKVHRINLLRTSTLFLSVYGAIFRNIIAPVIGISVTFIHKDEFNMHIANLWRNVGVRPIVYTVNSPNEKRYFQRVMRTQYLTDSLRSEPQFLFPKKK